ncbi:hypothetical protein [Paraburkholderia caledonica]|uniref:Uncharacterized protein n=1 Tax=Paraburkholderia caledonica TaxID=134536 RepID=A0AB73I4A7_9BURK|nr:hypothetical protein [Paraburkholderia caledonica]
MTRTIFCNFLHFSAAIYKTHPAKCSSPFFVDGKRRCLFWAASAREHVRKVETGNAKENGVGRVVETALENPLENPPGTIGRAPAA